MQKWAAVDYQVSKARRVLHHLWLGMLVCKPYKHQALQLNDHQRCCPSCPAASNCCSSALTDGARSVPAGLPPTRPHPGCVGGWGPLWRPHQRMPAQGYHAACRPPAAPPAGRRWGRRRWLEQRLEEVAMLGQISQAQPASWRNRRTLW